MHKRIFLIFICILLPLSLEISVADENNNEVTIANIIIKGNERVSNDTVLTYANISKGDVISPKLIQDIIKRLYQTNYFDDISVSQDFDDLIIILVEKPIVSDIIITDNAIIEDDDIITALDDVGISRTQPYDKNIF